MHLNTSIVQNIIPMYLARNFVEMIVKSSYKLLGYFTLNKFKSVDGLINMV